MKKLTKKEEEIMNLFWDKGAMFVRELLEHYDEPKPHFNTLSTMVRNLEANGYVNHKAYGNSYQYYPVVSREDYAGRTFKGIISSYFNNSYLSAVSTLVKEEKITVEELKELIAQIENGDAEITVNQSLILNHLLHMPQVIQGNRLIVKSLRITQI